MTPQAVWDRFRALPGQDMHDYAPFLREIARGNVLEIGVREGVSTSAFLLGLEDRGDPAGHLWSIDIDVICCNLFPRHPRWTFLHGDSTRDRFPLPAGEAFDVLLVDGDHRFGPALSDLTRFEPRVRPGGLILMHDVEPDDPALVAEWYPVEECRRAWKTFVAMHPGWKARVLPGLTGMGVMEKGA